MFVVRMVGYGGDEWAAKIDGCPGRGLAAIDFRRKHGLPDAPDDRVLLPRVGFLDEGFVRRHAGRANGDADISGPSQRVWRAEDDVLVADDRKPANGHAVTLPPAVIRAYLAERTPATMMAVLEEMWYFEKISLARACGQIWDLRTADGRDDASGGLIADGACEAGEAAALIAELCAILDRESEE